MPHTTSYACGCAVFNSDGRDINIHHDCSACHARKHARLSKAQERALLMKHATGDFGNHTWSTVRSLIAGEYVRENEEHNLEVTAKGKAYCDAHHLEIA